MENLVTEIRKIWQKLAFRRKRRDGEDKGVMTKEIVPEVAEEQV